MGEPNMLRAHLKAPPVVPPPGPDGGPPPRFAPQSRLRDRNSSILVVSETQPTRSGGAALERLAGASGQTSLRGVTIENP